MYRDVVGFLLHVVSLGDYNNVVSVRHMMQPTNHTVSEYSLMANSVPVYEKRISTLLIVVYHLNANCCHSGHY